MKRLITGWIAVKICGLALIWFLAFAADAPQAAQRTDPTPTPTPKVDDSIDRRTSDPYTGNLARFDRENRAEKLQIERIMDILEIKSGSFVADIGAGGGWFSAIASKRVGKEGKVYAVDIRQDSVEYIDKRMVREGLTNIETVLSTTDDPKLPEKSVGAVVILNTYHEIAEPVKFLRNLKSGLKRGALVGIIDREGKGDDHGIDQEVVKTEAARVGLTFVKSYDFVNKDRMDYFIVFANR
jgi:ubiquinone/menaquinone biosynthesis C-methylase UbiE